MMCNRKLAKSSSVEITELSPFGFGSLQHSIDRTNPDKEGVTPETTSFD